MIPTYLQPLEVRILGDAYDFGGSLVLWGSWRKYGENLVHRGLMTTVVHARENGRLALQVRLMTASDAADYLRLGFEPIDSVAIQDLAARCACALRRADSDSKRLGKFVKVAWRHVPAKLPKRGWPDGAKLCPACFCTPDKPCNVRLEDGCGTAVCVPAGVHDMTKCSACKFSLEVFDVDEASSQAAGPQETGSRFLEA